MVPPCFVWAGDGFPLQLTSAAGAGQCPQQCRDGLVITPAEMASGWPAGIPEHTELCLAFPLGPGCVPLTAETFSFSPPAARESTKEV